MTSTLYLIGYPASGKSTVLSLVAHAVGAYDREEFTSPIAHAAWYTADGRYLDVVELGKHRPSFSGTDALSMSAGPRAIDFVHGLATHPTAPPAWIVAEGDRLAYRRFLDACPNLHLVLLDLPADLARDRAVKRAAELGVQPQDEAWFRGRVTKTDNLVEHYHPTLHRLDATLPPETNAARIATWIGQNPEDR